jgi:hypothetical protein
MERTSPLAWILAALAAAAVFLTPAVWNGFPFVFYDSADYIGAAFTFQMPPFRLLPYAILAMLGRLGGSLWIAVLIQAGAILFTLALLARWQGQAKAPGNFLLIALGCALFTTAPWYAGLLMPDAFAPVAILSASLLLADWERMGRLKYAALALVPFSGMVHATHLMILAGLSLIGLVLWGFRQVRARAALSLAAATLAAWLLVPSLHAATQGSFTYNRGSSVFLLARLVSAGLVQQELPNLCARKPYLICGMQDRLYGQENDFLWGHGGVFFGRAGSLDVWIDEAPEIIGQVVRAHPWEALSFALSSATRLFFAFGPDDVFDPMAFHMQRALETHWPSLVGDLQNARQQHGWDAARFWLARVCTPVMAVGLAGLVLIFALALRLGERRQALLAGLLLAGLIGNALACGGLSSFAERYQARVEWIAFAFTLANLVWLKIRIYRRRPPGH